MPLAVGIGVVGLALSGKGSGTTVWKRMTFEGRPVLVLGSGRGRALVYFHGNGANIEEVAGTIAPSIGKAKRPPMVILPQLAPDGLFTPFLKPGGLGRLLMAAGAFGKSLSIVAHSGGYLAAADALDRYDGRVSGVGLLDALYARSYTFSGEVLRGTKLVDVYGSTTAAQSLALAIELRNKLGAAAVNVAEAGLGTTPLSKFAQGKRAAFARTDAHHAEIPARYLAATIDALG